MRVYLLLIAALLGVPAAPAQEKAVRTCRILFLGGPADAPEKAHLFDGTAAREVELPRMNFSPTYRLAGGDRVLRLLAKAPAKAEEVPPGAPQVKVPEAVRDCYLLVTSDPANRVLPLALQVIDAGSAKFRTGQMMWFNLTANRVGGKVGSRNLAMAPHSRAILDPPAAGNTDYPVNLAFRMPGNERLYPLCETKWLHDPRARAVYFIVGEPGVRTPRVLGFPDFREAGEADKEAGGEGAAAR
jgi:hypothetical protein